MATVKPVSSGFLGNDYALLTPGETAKGQAGLRYFNPAAQWRRYNKVMIEPVTFWGGALRPAAVDPTAGFSAGSPFTRSVSAFAAYHVSWRITLAAGSRTNMAKADSVG